MTRPIAALLTLAGILSATEADAQHLFRRGQARQALYVSSTPSTMTTPYATSAPSTITPAVGASSTRIYPYSYYVSGSLPSRSYVGYATDEFAYHGAPYGHPYDLWTWPYMSGSYSRGLARYYDPPVK